MDQAICFHNLCQYQVFCTEAGIYVCIRTRLFKMPSIQFLVCSTNICCSGLFLQTLFQLVLKHLATVQSMSKGCLFFSPFTVHSQVLMYTDELNWGNVGWMKLLKFWSSTKWIEMPVLLLDYPGPFQPHYLCNVNKTFILWF